MARLLFLGASVSQLAGIRYARAAGHYVVACDGDAHAVAFALCDAAHTVDFSDIDRVEDVARLEHVDGILAVCTDRAVVPAATVAARVGLPGIAIDVARAMTNKAKMRARLDEAGIPQPASIVLQGSDLTGADAIPLPAVVKPTDSGGQRGLFLVERAEDLPARLPAALAASSNGTAMFEEFVPGMELNVLLAVRDCRPTVLTVSDRLRPAGRGFGVGWIHSFPSSLTRAEQDRVGAVAEAAVRALGLRHGIAFAQLIRADDGAVVVIEVAARIAAGQMADLVEHATGINLYAIAIDQALGRPVSDAAVTPRFTRPIAIRFLTAAPGPLPVGTVTAIEGLDRAQKEEGVLDASLYFGLGTRIAPVQVDADRRGYLIATGATAAEALERADSAARRLRIRVEEGSQPPRNRLVAASLAAALLAAAVVVFLLVDVAKAGAPLAAAARGGARLSPTCGCAADVGHVAFRLVRGTTVVARMVEQASSVDATMIRDRLLAPGRSRIAWSGCAVDGPGDRLDPLYTAAADAGRRAVSRCDGPEG
jgi:biotin carboxylase